MSLLALFEDNKLMPNSLNSPGKNTHNVRRREMSSGGGALQHKYTVLERGGELRA